MAQKDKVKELVGRGLGSYHTKALQQMDRIERKNKEQNHKINILTSELDNDYLTKTEEGSVVSLEHSKEGMIYLDELQGNTLVNYCTDGAKELTLNGDIDVEGTSVTLTEGADNGKVDVVCEGNTMINLVKGYINGGVSGNRMQFSSTYRAYYTDMIKPNTIYTIITYKNGNRHLVCDSEYFSEDTVFELNLLTSQINDPNDYIVTKVTTSENAKYMYLYSTNNSSFGAKVMFLEGDWTNKEIPKEHFEGIKSVGELEDNKFEILSQNYQELNTDTNGLVCHLKVGTSAITNNIMSDLSGNGNNATLYGASINGNYLNFNGESDYATIDRCVSDDFTISLKAEVISAKGGSLENDGLWYNYAGLVDGEYPSIVNDFGLTITNEGYPCLGIGKPDITVRHKETCFNKLTTFTYTRNKTTGEMKLYIDGKHSATISSTNKNSLNDNPLLFIGKSATKTTAYAKMKFYELKIYNKVLNESEIFKFNKKEISLNEPLRGLPNGVKDKIVKIGGKWYVQRNCYQINFKEHPEIGLGYGGESSNTNMVSYSSWSSLVANGFPKGTDTSHSGMVSPRILFNNLPIIPKSSLSSIEGVGADGSGFNVSLSRTRLGITSDDRSINILKQWLIDNNCSIIYQLETPTYEEITDVELITYLDTTYISNNSTIPCNMKIQNSGYNAIIKPSTQYTVALDANKSGTIGINLGGAKVTTTNNVATITTPSTLTDDSLRLYGKGIKASKVRLLEGDKTNWIPSHFEGMKSSFEDKLQEDGTFKMEILSNNKNLIDIERMLNKDNYLKGTYASIKIPLKPNTTYYYKMDFKANNENRWIGVFSEPKGFAGTIRHLITWGNSNDRKITGQFTTDNSTEYYISIYKDWANFEDDAFYKELFTEVYNDFIICEENVDYTEGKSNKIQFSSIEPLKRVDDTKDKFIFKNNVLMIERNVGKVSIPSNFSVSVHRGSNEYYNSHSCGCYINTNIGNLIKTTGSDIEVICERFGYKYSIWSNGNYSEGICNIGGEGDGRIAMRIHNSLTGIVDSDDAGKCATKITNYLKANPFEVYFKLKEPTYEEVPFELQKIILEGYENGTLFIDTNIPPTSTVTYAGETPIVKSVRLNKTEVLNNTNDINNNIVPYLMDMDYRVVCLQLEGRTENVSMARLFGGTYEMLQRDILSNRYSKEEYKYRLDAYLSANKITENEYEKLGDMLND